MILIAPALATAAAFTGAAAYINLSEQPARLALDDASLLKEWKSSCAKGLEMQATLALVSGALGIAGWYFEQNAIAAFGGFLILVNWPYTFLVIAPTNRLLGAIADYDAGPVSRALIMKWGRLHAVRTFLGLAAAIVFIFAILRA